MASLLAPPKVPTRKAVDIDEIIVHCSATKEGRDFIGADIDVWHKKQGYSCCGYHYVVCRNGTIDAMRSVRCVGAHCIQQHKNRTSIGICNIGGLEKAGNPKDTRTAEQKRSLDMLIRKICLKYPIKRVSGHRDYAPKACPCFDAHAEYQKYVRP